MTYNHLLYIVNNKDKFRYDNATSGGSDTSVDASARFINPNDFLAPTVRQAGIIRLLEIIVLILLSIFLIKKTFSK